MPDKLISPLILEGAFLVGWAYDSRRSDLGVVLTVDGAPVSKGRTGLFLAAEHVAQLPPPPRANTGFVIPLPEIVRRKHEVTVCVSVEEWRGLPTAPEASVVIRSGSVFGEVSYAKGFYSGWVAFRTGAHIDAQIVITDCNRVPILAVQLQKTNELTRAGADWVGVFKVPADHPELPDSVRFWCDGQELGGSPTEALPEVVGSLEMVDERGIVGWALDRHRLGRTLELELFIDDRPYRRFYPNCRRPEIGEYLGLDLLEIGIAGFHLAIPSNCRDGRPHAYSVRCARTGARLNGDAKNFVLDRGWEEFYPSASDYSLQGPAHNGLSLPHGETIPEVSVIVLNRNGAHLLSPLFESWQRFNKAACEWLVVDHGSRDDSREVIRKWATVMPVRLIALDYNDSFSASCNRAAREASGKHLLFLNNDIVWVQDALGGMLTTLDDPEVGAVGLKLLKPRPAEINPSCDSEIQHLGIRFVLAGDQYWPYEINPEKEAEAGVWTSERVPGVTGAVMLVRKDEFLRIGGFDEKYFYGFEDVEFCLRLSRALGKSVVCRNDLAALHRHGVSRLSGRDLSVTNRLADNADVLATHCGLWLKRAVWRELLAGESFLSPDRLTVGVVVENNELNDRERSDISTLRERLRAVWPRCELVILPPRRGWKNVFGIHVLLVRSTRFDLRALQEARADLMMLAWGPEMLDRSRHLPWWERFDGCLVDKRFQPEGGFLGTLISDAVPIATITPQAPLGPWLSLKRLPLRIAIRVPDDAADGTPNAKSLVWSNARALQRHLRQAGQVCRLVSRDQWPNPPFVSDVDITIHASGKHAATRHRPSHSVHVLWVLEGLDELPPAELAAADGKWLDQSPLTSNGVVRELRQLVEKKIGRSVRPS